MQPSCFNCRTQSLPVLTLTNLTSATACIWRLMSSGGIFAAVKNSITARCLNSTSPQLSILTGNEPELWIAAGSRLCMVDGRYHVTSWNRFYPVFIILVKNVTEEAKTFQPVLVFQGNVR